MTYYCILWIPTTHKKALSLVEGLPVMENGDVQLTDINISDTSKPLLLNITLKEVSDSGSIEIKCGDLTLYLKREDTNSNGLVKFSYEYNKDEKNPLLTSGGNIIHAVYSAIKRFYHTNLFHEENHDSLLYPYYSKERNVDIKSPDNEALEHYLGCFEAMFDSFVSDFRSQSKKIDSYYAMPKGEERDRSLDASIFLLAECANALGISSFAKFLLSSKYNLSFETLNPENENTFSDKEKNLLNSIEEIKQIEAYIETEYIKKPQYTLILGLGRHVNDIEDALKTARKVQDDAYKTSKMWNKISIWFGAVGIISLIVSLISLFISIKTPASKKIDDICENRTPTLKGKKILVFTKNGEGYVHDNIQASVDMFFQLGKSERFSVDTTSNAALFSSPALRQYDIVVFDNTNNQVFDTQEERDGLAQYVRSGKGFMGVHIACGTEREWTWFKQMLGGTFDFHPQFQEFPVRVVDSLNLSTSGIPSPWVVKDELYVMKEMNPTIHILMVSDFSSPDFINASTPMPDTFGKVFPCVWCNTFDGGRQWFTALGHDKSCYTDPVFVRHILGGLKWLVEK